MDTIRQCWAYHTRGSRCEHPAGHSGNHMTSKTWTDLECATPGEFEEPPKKAEPATPMTVSLSMPVPVEVEQPTNCVACAHKHKGGPCRCGCYEYVG